MIDDTIETVTAEPTVACQHPLAVCEHDGEPLVSTVEYEGAAFVCVVCRRRYAFLEPRRAATTPALEARHAQHREQFLRERAQRRAARQAGRCPS